jgi:hypothetical protein
MRSLRRAVFLLTLVSSLSAIAQDIKNGKMPPPSGRLMAGTGMLGFAAHVEASLCHMSRLLTGHAFFQECQGGGHLLHLDVGSCQTAGGDTSLIGNWSNAPLNGTCQISGGVWSVQASSNVSCINNGLTYWGNLNQCIQMNNSNHTCQWTICAAANVKSNDNCSALAPGQQVANLIEVPAGCTP